MAILTVHGFSLDSSNEWSLMPSINLESESMFGVYLKALGGEVQVNVRALASKGLELDTAGLARYFAGYGSISWGSSPETVCAWSRDSTWGISGEFRPEGGPELVVELSTSRHGEPPGYRPRSRPRG